VAPPRESKANTAKAIFLLDPDGGVALELVSRVANVFSPKSLGLIADSNESWRTKQTDSLSV
jgi:hypothetical protein